MNRFSNNNFNNLGMTSYFTKPVTNMEWVSGPAGAAAYLLQGYNSMVALFDGDADNDNMKVYIKSTDETGRPSLRKFKMIEEIDEAPAQSVPQLSEYVRKDELESLIKSILPQPETQEESNNEQSVSTVQPVVRKVISSK